MIRRRPDRRALMATGAASLLLAGPLADPARAADLRRALAGIELETGGRIGVTAGAADGAPLAAWRASERFAMCSTFKVLLAAAVLSRIDRGQLSGETLVGFTKADLLDYAPAARAALPRGRMSVFELCQAAVGLSDNTAANLLLGKVGGPAGLTAWLASIGDRTTHLDRTEPSLNTNLAGDPRDTTTPEAFAWTLARLVEGTVLGEASRRRLNAWMVGCRTGLARLRAGLPAGWVAGDKTGTGAGGAINDVAVVRPPGRPPVIIVCFMSGSTRPQGDLEAAQAKLARLIAASIG